MNNTQQTRLEQFSTISRSVITRQTKQTMTKAYYIYQNILRSKNSVLGQR